MPNEKNSAASAISPAVTVARGSSIIVPHSRWSSRTPSARSTSAATGSSSARICSSSGLVATSGIMISTFGSRPSCLTRAAASQIARTCIAYSPGFTIPSRTPRRPSIGLASWSWSTLPRITRASSSGTRSSRSRTSSSPRSSARATPTASSTWFGRNSCSGGSSSRTVTGRPSMARKIPTKSSRCSGSSASYAFCSSCLGLREDHLAHRADPLLAEEHVLGPAQPDALGAAVARVARLVGRVGVRADPQTTAPVGDAHQALEGLPDLLPASLLVAGSRLLELGLLEG